MKNGYYFLLSIAVLIFGIAEAQVDKNSELHQLFLTKDSLLFDAGFNNCELDMLTFELSDDLEFYHDQGGFQNKADFLKAMKENICANPLQKPIRKLIPNTYRVFPMYDNGQLYAAIVEGKHEFFIQEPGSPLRKTGSALFSGLWLKENNRWQAKRIFSYHHQPE